jgi:hypothetical protein
MASSPENTEEFLGGFKRRISFATVKGKERKQGESMEKKQKKKKKMMMMMRRRRRRRKKKKYL